MGGVINRKAFFKAKVTLYSDTDDIENDMNELLQMLSNEE